MAGRGGKATTWAESGVVDADILDSLLSTLFGWLELVVVVEQRSVRALPVRPSTIFYF